MHALPAGSVGDVALTGWLYQCQRQGKGSLVVVEAGG